MSLILDALRKSEHERQREAGPPLSVVPESRPVNRAPRWLPAVIALLALNVVVVVLAALLLRNPAPEPAAQAPAPAGPATRPAPTTATPPAAAPAQRTAPAASPAATETASAPLDLPARTAQPEVRPLTTELSPSAAATPATGTPAPASTPTQGSTPAAAARPAPSPAERAEADAQLPRFADLVVRGELNVPHMHLDIHVYSTDPAQRFVFVNMKRYNEGDATAEGPRIERIVPGGVVMDHRGQRFLLTRD